MALEDEVRDVSTLLSDIAAEQGAQGCVLQDILETLKQIKYNTSGIYQNTTAR